MTLKVTLEELTICFCSSLSSSSSSHFSLKEENVCKPSILASLSSSEKTLPETTSFFTSKTCGASHQQDDDDYYYSGFIDNNLFKFQERKEKRVAAPITYYHSDSITTCDHSLDNHHYIIRSHHKENQNRFTDEDVSCKLVSQFFFSPQDTNDQITIGREHEIEIIINRSGLLKRNVFTD